MMQIEESKQVTKIIPLKSVVDPVAVKVMTKINRDMVAKLLPDVNDDTYAFCSYTKPLEAVEKSLGIYIFPESISTLTYVRLLKCSNIECRLVKYGDLSNTEKFRVLKRLYTSYVTLSFRALDMFGKYLTEDEKRILYGETWYWACILYFQMRDVGASQYRIAKEVISNWLANYFEKLYKLSVKNRDVVEEFLRRVRNGEIHTERSLTKSIDELVQKHA